MQFQMNALSDYHVHLRQGIMLKNVVKFHQEHSQRILVMPNTVPPVWNDETLVKYRNEIRDNITKNCKPIMSIKFLPETTPDVIRDAKKVGCQVVKIYPSGVTTNSNDGISKQTLQSLLVNGGNTPENFLNSLKSIEENELVLSIHGEMPGYEVLYREEVFAPVVKRILELFPKIRIVLEHISTRESVRFVRWARANHPGRLAATITPHHLLYTLTDMLGESLRPHMFCKPVVKNEMDRKELILAAISGENCFFLGSDSAPHYQYSKESDHGCAGVWNAPCIPETLAEIFEKANALDKLEDFTSIFGDDFYREYIYYRQISLEKTDKKIPGIINGIVPFRSGETIPWTLIGDTS